MIQASLEIFVEMLNYMYLPDTDQDCKDNLREFIEQLHDGGMEGEA